MQNFRQTAQEPIKFTAPSGGVVSGVPLLIGALCVVPQTTALVGETFAGLTEGVFVFTKATGTAYTEGEVAYFDFATDDRIEATGTPIGFHVVDAASGDTTAKVVLDRVGASAAVLQQTVSVFLQPGSATVKTGAFVAPFDGKIKGISYYVDVKPTSSAGTVLGVLQNAALSDHTLLSTANIDLELLTEDAVTALTLTATAADLVLLKGQVAEFVCTPNNTDLVAGTGIHFIVTFERTA